MSHVHGVARSMRAVSSQTPSGESTNASVYTSSHPESRKAIQYANNSTRRMSELQQESEDLRRKLRASHPADPHPSPIALLTAAAEMAPRSEPNSDSMSGTPNIPPPSYPPQLLAPNGLGISPSTPAPAPALEGDTTRSRSLHGVEVRGDEIDDLFHMCGFKIPEAYFPLLTNPCVTASSATTPNSYPFSTHNPDQTHTIHNPPSSSGA